jgi:hypothetical protein
MFFSAKVIAPDIGATALPLRPVCVIKPQP